jgi:hypothetical protein
MKMMKSKAKMGETCSKVEDLYKILVTKPEGKRPLGMPRHGWGSILD